MLKYLLCSVVRVIVIDLNIFILEYWFFNFYNKKINKFIF